jgi:hypothetical protein
MWSHILCKRLPNAEIDQAYERWSSAVERDGILIPSGFCTKMADL